MKTPTYLNNKQQVVIFKSNETINRSKFDLSGKSLNVFESGTLFIYVEEYSREINIKLSKNTNTKLYLILKTSQPSIYDFHVFLEQEAILDVFTVFRNVEKTSLTINREFILEKSSELKISNALLNMGETTLNEFVSLNGEQANVELDMLNIGSYNDVFVVNQDISHKEKSTISNITNSLISNANSVLDYSVSGRILKGNEHSSCKQTNKGIILSEVGEISVEPKLVIDEYNVEASHGAAIGQIDEEQLYYLLSRGLTESEARNLIISGYTKPFVNKIDDEDIKELVERQILKSINEADIL